MTQPVLSVIIPTIGRPSLERTVRSLLQQSSWLRWEGVLVGDTHRGTWAQQLPFARQVADRHPRHLVYVEHDGGTHAWGHPQRQYGATVARGEYLWWLSDDDVALPGAFDALHRAIAGELSLLHAERHVFLFRWIAPWKQVLWHTAGFLAQDHIDAECLVAPNVPERLGTWTHRYQGDFDCIRETVQHWGGPERIMWQAEVLAQAQPTREEDWTLGGQQVAPVQAHVEPRAVFIPIVDAPVEVVA